MNEFDPGPFVRGRSLARFFLLGETLTASRVSAQATPDLMALRHVQVTSVCRSVKKKGEDTHATLDADIGGELVYLSMVADGHGGAAAAEQCRSELLADIVAEAQDSAPDELTRAIHTCFVAIHERIRATTESGAACTVVAIVASTGAVTCANSGDVLAVGFSPANSHPLHLAMSHRLEERGSRTTESDRVITAGGKICLLYTSPSPRD